MRLLVSSYDNDWYSGVGADYVDSTLKNGLPRLTLTR